MSLRAVGKIWLAGSLTLWGAACSDGNSTAVDVDAGNDAGDSDVDAGSDAGTTPSCEPIVNDQGEECPCVPLINRNEYAAPCWVPETGECGVSIADLPGVTPGDVACAKRDAVGTPSRYCGEFFDQLDALLRDKDGKIEYDDAGKPQYATAAIDGRDRGLTVPVQGMDIKLTFEGCCLPSGECGALLSIPRPIGASEPGGEGVVISAFTNDPFDLHLGCVGINDIQQILGGSTGEEQLDPALYTNLPYCQYSEKGDPGVITSGTVPGVPEFVCGCGEGKTETDSGIPCLQNIDADVCGAEPISDTEKALFPQYVCGCEGATGVSVVPCLPEVASTECGTAPLDDDQFAGIPRYICGVEGNDPRLPSILTLPNLPADRCGGAPFDVETDPLLPLLPEYLCGATDSATIRPGSASLPKLPNLSADYCGGYDVMKDDPTLAGLPEFLCGCELTTALPFDAAEFGCLPNIPRDVCGTAAVATGNPLLDNVPVFVSGCGADVVDDGVGALCLSNVETTVHGARATDVNNRNTPDVPGDDCLTGVPEYARGCGDNTEPSEQNPSCLRDSRAVFGCENVTTPIARLPNALCGCGEGQVGSETRGPGLTDAGRPCLPFVAVTVCGTIPQCGPVGTQGTAGGCAQGQICADVLSPGDGIGDYCAPLPT